MNPIDHYKESVLELTSQNRVSALLGEIEHLSTLDEVLSFAEWIESGGSESPWKEVEEYWLGAFREKLSKIDSGVRRDWVNTWHQKSLHYFTSASEQRVLLVCFSGRFGWMFLPNWLFLAYLPSQVTDVLLIQSKKAYLDENFVRFKSIWADIHQHVHDITQLHEFLEIKVLGVSGGCVGATLFAAQQEVSDLTIIGAPSLSDEDFNALDTEATKMLHHRVFTKSLRARYICGIRDLRALREIPRFFRLFPKRKIRVVPSTGHNVFIDMYNQGKLSKAMTWIM